MGRQALLSPHWYRVAPLHPRLTEHVSVHRQKVRGGIDHVLRDSANGRMVRLNESAWQLAGRMDGRATFDEIWKAVREREGRRTATQAEAIGVLSTLVERGLVQCESTPDSMDVLERESQVVRRERRNAFNPLAVRLPLGDPSALLERLSRQMPRMPAGLVMVLWGLLIASAMFLLADHVPALSAHAAEIVAAPRGVLLLWVLYPIVKALHELAHAMTLRAWGGSVREVGVTLMMGVPVPYVDASDVDAFPERGRRIAVSAAGILCELALAALAALLWVAVQPGWVRDSAMLVMLIGCISTLFFNGNPLMRMDGHHILAEAIGMPNLALRSRAVLRGAAVRLFTGANPRAVADASQAERFGLAAFGLACVAYRFIVAGAVVLWAAKLSSMLAIGLGATFAFGLLVRPLFDALRYLGAAPALARHRTRHASRAVTIAAAIAAIVAFVPVPMRVIAQGVVWVPPEAETRVGEDGFVTRVLVNDGAAVLAGQALFQLNEPSLVAQREQAQQRLVALDIEFHNVVLSEPSRAQGVSKAMEAARAELKRIEQRLEALVVRSAAAGTVSILHPTDWPERFVKKGSTVAHVIGDDLIRVRTVVEDGDVEMILGGLRGAEVRLADRPSINWSAELQRETPAATRKLPNAVLGERGGGRVAVDPADEQGLTALRPVHVLDLKLPRANLAALGGRVGTRAYVSFDLPARPLLDQGVHALRQLFLRHLSSEA